MHKKETFDFKYFVPGLFKKDKRLAKENFANSCHNFKDKTNTANCHDKELQ